MKKPAEHRLGGSSKDAGGIPDPLRAQEDNRACNGFGFDQFERFGSGNSRFDDRAEGQDIAKGRFHGEIEARTGSHADQVPPVTRLRGSVGLHYEQRPYILERQMSTRLLTSVSKGVHLYRSHGRATPRRRSSKWSGMPSNSAGGSSSPTAMHGDTCFVRWRRARDASSRSGRRQRTRATMHARSGTGLTAARIGRQRPTYLR
jgi:hypothetical protein